MFYKVCFSEYQKKSHKQVFYIGNSRVITQKVANLAIYCEMLLYFYKVTVLMSALLIPQGYFEERGLLLLSG